MIITNTYNEFIQKANSYCELIEKRDDYELTDFLREVLISLIDVYRSDLFLEPIECDDNIGEREMTHDEWASLFSSLHEKLGNKTYYACVFDPTDWEDKEFTVSDLADDLSDIYRDFKDSINLFNKSEVQEQNVALWDFRFNFINHSSGHICDAIRAIHYFEIDCKDY